MIVSIHQPHFFPWLGYLDRMRRCDLFVLLDHVQFERQNYQNRVAIKTRQGPRWLVVPVRQRSRSERLVDKRVDDQARGRRAWGARAYRVVEQAYAGAPFFARWAPEVRSVLECGSNELVQVNLASLELLRRAFDIRTPLLLSSTLELSRSGADLVLEICRALGADVFLGGLGASRRYLDPARFRSAGIEVRWQQFQHPRYPQHPLEHPFVEGVSAIDLLFNCSAPYGLWLLDGSGPLRPPQNALLC